MKRYFIADKNGIPLFEQPSNGYTKLQVIARVQREAEYLCKRFNVSYKQALDCFIILDNKLIEDKYLKECC